jgi:four helix bundle protein
MFSHEKLLVYGKALGFASTAAGLVSNWDKRHAVVDQLSRASESIALNLAEAARQRGAPGRLTDLDYAIGSTLECAACLDIARIKKLAQGPELEAEKRRLCEITKMLMGLRKSWNEPVLREDSPVYGDENMSHLFHHERLEVYQKALSCMEWFAAEGEELSAHSFRRMDEVVTSLILNIAEGNGRYAELDRQRFWKIAESAAVKVAVYLDLCVGKGVFPKEAVGAPKDTLREINRMLMGMR